MNDSSTKFINVNITINDHNSVINSTLLVRWEVMILLYEDNL